jgi:hypothetical protein
MVDQLLWQSPPPEFPLATKTALYRASKQVFPTGSSKSACDLKRVKFQVLYLVAPTDRLFVRFLLPPSPVFLV